MPAARWHGPTHGKHLCAGDLDYAATRTPAVRHHTIRGVTIERVAAVVRSAKRRRHDQPVPAAWWPQGVSDDPGDLRPMVAGEAWATIRNHLAAALL